MEQLRKFIENDRTLSNDEVLEIFTLVGSNGDVIILKNDGLRDTCRFTVVITHSGEPIRYDDETLSGALKKSLKEYLKL